jgi:hypothetical protein
MDRSRHLAPSLLEEEGPTILDEPETIRLR